MTTKTYAITIERRKDVRNKVHIPARLYFAETGTPALCVIANISSGGIKIDLEESGQPPSGAITVEETLLGTRFDCAVQWCKGAEIGLRFLAVSNPENLERLLAMA